MARLEELERKFEENPRRYFAPLANEYRKSGDARRAAELCQSQLPEVPGHISGHIVLGQALYDVSDFAASRAALEAALALDPENIVALRYLGDIARDTGDVAEAERWYRRTLEADPYNEAAAAGLQSLQDHQQVADTAPEAAPEIAPEAGSELPSEPAPAWTFETASEPTAEADHERVAKTGPEPSPEPAAEAGDDQFFETDAVIQYEPVAEIGPETSAEADPSPEAMVAAEPQAKGLEPTSQEPEHEPQLDETAESVEATSEATSFMGDLEISAVPDGSEAPSEPQAASQDDAPADMREAPDEPEATPQDDAPPEVAAAAQWQPEPESVEESAPIDPAVQQAVIQEEPIQTEERVMESAAPFVTETMADLYMEQGYPHEALELLLQLSEQRPDDRQLAVKIEHLESVINARRDAAVAAARAERAAAIEPESEPEPEPELESQPASELASEPEPEAQPEPEAVAASTMREMFARMDRARPRTAGAVSAKPLSRLRSDFVPLPDASEASTTSDDPFAFPNPAPPSEPVPRSSGPQPTFNPSTAANDDFDAWLRGLKGS